jgi:hypothetical protein
MNRNHLHPTYEQLQVPKGRIAAIQHAWKWYCACWKWYRLLFGIFVPVCLAENNSDAGDE